MTQTLKFFAFDFVQLGSDSMLNEFELMSDCSISNRIDICSFQFFPAKNKQIKRIPGKRRDHRPDLRWSTAIFRTKNYLNSWSLSKTWTTSCKYRLYSMPSSQSALAVSFCSGFPPPFSGLCESFVGGLDWPRPIKTRKSRRIFMSPRSKNSQSLSFSSTCIFCKARIESDSSSKLARKVGPKFSLFYPISS